MPAYGLSTLRLVNGAAITAVKIVVHADELGVLSVEVYGETVSWSLCARPGRKAGKCGVRPVAHAAPQETGAPVEVALLAEKMSRTDSVATPAALTEKAALTQPPISMGIATMSGVAVLIVVLTPSPEVLYANRAVMLPLLAPVTIASRLMLKDAVWETVEVAASS